MPDEEHRSSSGSLTGSSSRDGPPSTIATFVPTARTSERTTVADNTGVRRSDRHAFRRPATASRARTRVTPSRKRSRCRVTLPKRRRAAYRASSGGRPARSVRRSRARGAPRPRQRTRRPRGGGIDGATGAARLLAEPVSGFFRGCLENPLHRPHQALPARGLGCQRLSPAGVSS